VVRFAPSLRELTLDHVRALNGWIVVVVLPHPDKLDTGAMLFPVLFCTVLYCTVLYCTVLYCTVLYCTVLYCTVLYCTVLYCSVFSCTVGVLYCTVVYCRVVPYRSRGILCCCLCSVVGHRRRCRVAVWQRPSALHMAATAQWRQRRLQQLAVCAGIPPPPV
jgi:hypothetical protein